MTDLQEIKADVAPFGPDEKAWLIAEVERLKAELFDSSSTTMVETVRQAVAAEQERAAVLVGLIPEVEGENIRTTIAAAIRAKIKT